MWHYTNLKRSGLNLTTKTIPVMKIDESSTLKQLMSKLELELPGEKFQIICQASIPIKIELIKIESSYESVLETSLEAKVGSLVNPGRSCYGNCAIQLLFRAESIRALLANSCVDSNSPVSFAPAEIFVSL